MDKNKIWGIGLTVTIVALIGIMWYGARPASPYANLNPFAQCLASKQVTMYGAYWCPHCQNQKKLFGSSFEFVPYVECTEEADRCLKAGVEGYPTWVFADGKKVSGELSLEELAEKTGCELPVSGK